MESAVSGLSLVGNLGVLSASVVPVFAVGFIVSFVTALFVIRWLIRFVSHRSFDVFAWYRIGFGLLLIVLLASGQQWMR